VTREIAIALAAVLLAGLLIGYGVGYAAGEGDCGLFHEYSAVRR
jgi:hypothetical protein